MERDKAEHVCDVSFFDATEPRPNGLRFIICMPQDDIRFSSFYNVNALPTFLQAACPPQQFARVGPLEDKDNEAVKQLAIFMKRQSLVSRQIIFGVVKWLTCV